LVEVTPFVALTTTSSKEEACSAAADSPASAPFAWSSHSPALISAPVEQPMSMALSIRFPPDERPA
jgi:hypothetical protein